MANETVTSNATAGRNLLPDTIAAEIIGKHPRTLANWRVAGIGPRYVRVGRSAFYRQSDLDAWVEAHVYQSTSEEPRSSSRAAATDAPQSVAVGV